MKISESRRLDLRQMIAVTWPDFPLHQETLVPFQPQGWDYDSVSIGPWVLRAGRSQASRRHLQYEMAKLDTLNLPIPTPRYQWRSNWGGIYQRLPGAPASSHELQRPDRKFALSEFVSALQRPEHLPRRFNPVRCHRHWRLRYQQLWNEINEWIVPLLSMKQHRYIAGRVREFLGAEEHFRWNPVLLHGDLTPGHILLTPEGIGGIIDFGDMMTGDPALDWAGWAAGEMPPEFEGRAEFYRWIAPAYDVLRSLAHGSVEQAETALGRWITLWR